MVSNSYCCNFFSMYNYHVLWFCIFYSQDWSEDYDLGPIWNQGSDETTCWAICVVALADIFDRIVGRHNGDTWKYSPQPIINHFVRAGLFRRDGGYSPVEALNYFIRYGLPTLAQCPYIGFPVLKTLDVKAVLHIPM